MEILVCVKRVPTVGGKITVTPDGQQVPELVRVLDELGILS